MTYIIHVILTAFSLVDCAPVNRRSIITAYDDNPEYVKIFRDPNNDGNLMKRFLENDNVDQYEITRNGDYIFHIPLREYDDNYEDYDEEFSPIPAEDIPSDLLEKLENQDPLPNSFYGKIFKVSDLENANTDNSEDNKIPDGQQQGGASIELNKSNAISKFTDSNDYKDTIIHDQFNTISEDLKTTTEKEILTTTNNNDNEEKLFLSQLIPESNQLAGNHKQIHFSNGEHKISTGIHSNEDSKQNTKSQIKEQNTAANYFSKFFKDTFGISLYRSNRPDELTKVSRSKGPKINSKTVATKRPVTQKRLLVPNNKVFQIHQIQNLKKSNSKNGESIYPSVATFLPKNTRKTTKKPPQTYETFPTPGKVSAKHSPLPNIAAWFLLNQLGLSNLRRSARSTGAKRSAEVRDIYNPITNAWKFIAPRKFPKSGANVYQLPTLEQELPKQFLEKTIEENIIENEITSLKDLYGSKIRKAGQNFDVGSFEQIM